MSFKVGDRVKLKQDLFSHKAGTEGDIVSLQCPFSFTTIDPRHQLGKGLYIHFDGVPIEFNGQCIEKKYLQIKVKDVNS